MRRIHSNEVREKIREAALAANTRLPDDVSLALQDARQREHSARAGHILDIILENAELARAELGPEALRKLEFKDFPCIVAIDARANNIYK